ncbi:hypothetical protein LS482_17145 [Sinomicrobium kalidii]|uniref:hypothetical protein n=1 Tax=Sinomicrobium kalidii TaxID=2900738 RepID=UPI001E5EFC73|nr:hypothetical protein [Sinomicrobium kalidii]UGU15395.1 hypothetical protein LS482_17145 [Sinomicrobium kalidii]
MKPNEAALLRRLKKGAKDYHPTLSPHSLLRGKYQVNFFYMEDHMELMFTVRSLLNVCIMAIDPEQLSERPSRSKQETYIRQVLVVMNRLTPKGEEGLLDDINRYFREEGFRKNTDKK